MFSSLRAGSGGKTSKSSTASTGSVVDYVKNSAAAETRSPDSAPNRSDETREKEESDLPESFVTSKDPTKLFSFVKKKNWAGVVKRCKGEDRKEASTWVVEHNADGKLRWKLLPIHEACENKAPSEVIKALVAAYPESLLMKDTAGDLPLHLACREKSSKAVLAALLSTEPTAAKVKDDEGKLPLHLACRQGVAVQIVDSLIVCHYRATRTPDSYNLLPLHWACAQNASVGIVESLLRANPDAIDHKDKWDRTPLSLATASTNPDKEEILAALKKDPGFWSNKFVDEIDHLKSKLKQKDQSSSKVEQIQLENAMLKEKINALTGMNKFSDDDIDKVTEENSVLGQEVDVLKKKLNEFVFIFRSMEDQRKTLVDLAERMENSIQQAVNTAGNEYMEWGDPLTSDGNKNRVSRFEDEADESDFSD